MIPPPDLTPGLTIDVRPLFPSNPWRAVPLRRLTGLDPAVGQWIRDQKGYAAGLDALTWRILDYQGLDSGPVYLGCTGGRHRSVYLAAYLGRIWNLPVQHVHIDRGHLTT